jgi:NADH-quinone oxidoreductase subunit J
MNINIILLIILILAAIWTVMTSRLLRSAIGLAVTSVILAILIFQLSSPLAAVFELSVCAGLISAIFISAISLTQRVGPESETLQRKKEKFSRFWFLPLIIIFVAVFLIQFHVNFPSYPLAPSAENNVKVILWNFRHLDLLGQIAILLAGAFGVVSLFKD